MFGDNLGFFEVFMMIIMWMEEVVLSSLYYKFYMILSTS